MDNSFNTGLMAVFAVSGSVVFLSMQAHKRLLSNFMEKMECEINKPSTGTTIKDERKKKVRFADDVVEPAVGKAYVKHPSRGSAAPAACRNIKEENLEGVPKNWQVMYKGILQSRNLKRVS